MGLRIMLLPIQCKMARTALGWGVIDLSNNAKVSTNTVSRFERGDPLKARTVEALQTTLETAGIEFIPRNNDGGPGLRLTKQEMV